MPRLLDKVAVITGAARGQGRSHAVRLAEEGADIIAIDICAPIPSTRYSGATEDDLAETARLVEKLGRRAITARADVRDLDALTAAVDDGVAALGRLDVVAANAGIFSSSPATDLSPQAWSEMIDINLTGAWHTCRAAIPHLISGGRGGSIVITSSVAGLKGVPNMVGYVAAKHGVVGLMRTLALELAPHRIRVNTLHPTQVNTPMIHNEAMYQLFVPHEPHPTTEQFAEVSRAHQPLGVNWVEPVDVSNALLFLASDDARYITGAALPVDAGATIR
ncbi:MAG TPA: mycofactocin-coupled SDR family oxidoreductase [Amycolatopsis sp.]|nr:mycofactocin-coupled SDR family oxidoreductase [Amycolatopsis sp.]